MFNKLLDKIFRRKQEQPDALYTRFSAFLIRNQVYQQFIRNLNQYGGFTLEHHVNTYREDPEDLVSSAFMWGDYAKDRVSWAAISIKWKDELYNGDYFELYSEPNKPPEQPNYKSIW